MVALKFFSQLRTKVRTFVRDCLAILPATQDPAHAGRPGEGVCRLFTSLFGRLPRLLMRGAHTACFAARPPELPRRFGAGAFWGVS